MAVVRNIEDHRREIRDCIKTNRLSGNYKKEFYVIAIGLDQLAQILLNKTGDIRFAPAEDLSKYGLQWLNEVIEQKGSTAKLSAFSEAINAAKDYMAISYISESKESEAAYKKLLASYDKLQGTTKGPDLFREKNKTLRKVLGALAVLTGIAALIVGWTLLSTMPIYFLWFISPITIASIGLISGGCTLLAAESNKPAADGDGSAAKSDFTRSIKELANTSIFAPDKSHTGPSIKEGHRLGRALINPGN